MGDEKKEAPKPEMKPEPEPKKEAPKKEEWKPWVPPRVAGEYPPPDKKEK